MDIESDGHNPVRNSMISLGAYVFSDKCDVEFMFSVNIEPRPHTIQDPETMDFWAKFPEEYATTKINALPYPEAMKQFREFLLGVQATPVYTGTLDSQMAYICYPTTFDYVFISHYFSLAGLVNPCHSAIDIRSYVMGKHGCTYKKATKNKLPKIPSNIRHTHIALDDAVEQGLRFKKEILTFKS